MEKGEGHPLVFLHGFGLNKESFAFQTEYFCKDYRVIAIDFPGAGKSAPLRAAYGVKEYAEGVYALLTAMGIKRATIIGHSFGGRIAIYLAANTDIVSRLVLASSAGIKPRFSLKKAILRRRFSKRKKNMGETERMQWGSPDYRSLSPLEKQSFSKVVRKDLTPLLSKLSCPTLIVAGKRDGETPLYTAKKLYKGIKNAKLVVFKNTGHFAMLERKEDFNRTLMAFFRATEGEGL